MVIAFRRLADQAWSHSYPQQGAFVGPFLPHPDKESLICRNETHRDESLGFERVDLFRGAEEFRLRMLASSFNRLRDCAASASNIASL
jgi:hypothetical protein